LKKWALNQSFQGINNIVYLLEEKKIEKDKKNI